jgi:preprotein translocase subunit SecD
MVIASKVFNTYLIVLLLLSLIVGCQSPEKKAKSRLAALNVHLESRDFPDREEKVSISRDHPFTLTVQKSAFLTHNDIAIAKVVEVVGGFAISLQFTHAAASLLNQYTSNYPGKHLAIFCEFPSPTKEHLNEGRWLAAPRINRRISDGILLFTPDATREEADQIVLGLNNVAKKLSNLPPHPEEKSK